MLLIERLHMGDGLGTEISSANIKCGITKVGKLPPQFCRPSGESKKESGRQ